MIQVYLYTDELHAEASEKIKDMILGFQEWFDLRLNEIQIPADHWLVSHASSLPILKVGNFTVADPLNASAVESALTKATHYLQVSKDRRDSFGINSLTKPIEMTASDRLALWFSRSYVWFFGLIILIYVGLPVLAPILMKTGNPEPASLIYRSYRMACHELAYRSFFLFGDQAVYPREVAGIEGLKTFEEVSGSASEDTLLASQFVGNEVVGYKIGLCQRDLAIYGSMLLFALLFGLTKRKIKAIPWYVWVIVALGPIGLDGVSQLISQMQWPWLSWLTLRESTPFLRVLTGFLFGWFTAWYAFPTIEEVLHSSRERLELMNLAYRALDEK